VNCPVYLTIKTIAKPPMPVRASFDSSIITDATLSDSRSNNILTFQRQQSLFEEIADTIACSVKSPMTTIEMVARRVEVEVVRICEKSERIQKSGEQKSWQIGLAKHRIAKFLYYYELGIRQSKIELHSQLSAIVYRYITPPNSCHNNFSARYGLIEDFLQDFYMESLKVFRRENNLDNTYTPRGMLPIAEYIAFTEGYAKRRIALGKSHTQQLIVLRAQTFSKRQPLETSIDLEQAFDTASESENEFGGQGKILQQIRSKLVDNDRESSDHVLRDAVIQELIDYLREEEQENCIDYFLLRLEDLSAPEIEEILHLTPRQRDYLQQKFKYHVEKFSRNSRWKLVHEWLGADVEHKLGLTSIQWERFWQELTIQQKTLWEMKSNSADEDIIRSTLKLTPKKYQMRWSEILSIAAKFRNNEQ
jgi:hypothetical protein